MAIHINKQINTVSKKDNKNTVRRYFTPPSLCNPRGLLKSDPALRLLNSANIITQICVINLLPTQTTKKEKRSTTNAKKGKIDPINVPIYGNEKPRTTLTYTQINTPSTPLQPNNPSYNKLFLEERRDYRNGIRGGSRPNSKMEVLEARDPNQLKIWVSFLFFPFERSI